ncbi:hypothetical protein ABBQ32_004078 [Trebouxia sp. C0010 RCD-2024]
MATTDNQVSGVKRMRGKDDKPGILIVTCKSVHERSHTLKAAKQLKGRRIRVHCSWIKLQAQETWFSQVCQSASTMVQCVIDNMLFDLDKMAPCLLPRPFPALLLSSRSS